MVLIVNGLTRGSLLTGLLFLALSARSTTGLADGEGLPNDRLGRSTAPLLLLSRPDVRRDLRLSEAQSRKAEQAIEALYTRAQGLKGKKGAAADAARKTIDQDQVLWIETNLNPEQQGRLIQLGLQWEGPSAIVTRPIVADTLALTPEQRTTLRQAVEARNVARARATFSQTVEDVLTEKTLETLSPVQVERWLAMLGQPLFSPRATAAKDANSMKH